MGAAGGRGSEINGLVTRDMFLAVINDTDVNEALDDLEINCSDRSTLFDVLDADGSGSIDISELIAGLMKLRMGGNDMPVDMIASYLGIRAIQAQLNESRPVLLPEAERGCKPWPPGFA